MVFLVGAVNVANAYTVHYGLSDPNNSRIDGPTNQTIAEGEDGEEVYAYPYFGYRFVDWSDGRTDNPRTDLNVTTAISVTANFTSAAPEFTCDLLSKPYAVEDRAYSGTLAGDASDIDSNSLDFSVIDGPAWLAVAADGALSGMPTSGDLGPNRWTIGVDDGHGGTDTATLQIMVIRKVWSEGFAKPGKLTSIGNRTIHRLFDKNIHLRKPPDTRATRWGYLGRRALLPAR